MSRDALYSQSHMITMKLHLFDLSTQTNSYCKSSAEFKHPAQTRDDRTPKYMYNLYRVSTQAGGEKA